MGAKLVKEEGFGSLYKGLSAGLLRQATYTTARLGIYAYISDALTERHQGKVRANDSVQGNTAILLCSEATAHRLEMQMCRVENTGCIG